MVPADPAVLIVVAGWPAAGKTTLARRLGERLGVPVFTKDDNKELLFDTLGTGDREWGKRLGRASIALLEFEIETALAAGHSVIGEANWDAGLSSPQLRGIVERTRATPFVVSVQADAEVIVDRYRSRDRHPGHLDDELLGEIAEKVQRRYVAPDLGVPALEVDLTDMSAVDAALDEITQALQVSAPDALKHRPGEASR